MTGEINGFISSPTLTSNLSPLQRPSNYSETGPLWLTNETHILQGLFVRLLRVC